MKRTLKVLFALIVTVCFSAVFIAAVAIKPLVIIALPFFASASALYMRKPKSSIGKFSKFASAFAAGAIAFPYWGSSLAALLVAAAGLATARTWRWTGLRLRGVKFQSPFVFEDKGGDKND